MHLEVQMQIQDKEQIAKGCVPEKGKTGCYLSVWKMHEI